MCGTRRLGRHARPPHLQRQPVAGVNVPHHYPHLLPPRKQKAARPLDISARSRLPTDPTRPAGCEPAPLLLICENLRQSADPSLRSSVRRPPSGPFSHQNPLNPAPQPHFSIPAAHRAAARLALLEMPPAHSRRPRPFPPSHGPPSHDRPGQLHKRPITTMINRAHVRKST